MNKIRQNRLLFWLLSAGLFLTVIFSTSLHLFWTRESTINPHYFTNPTDPFPRHDGYDDMGMLRVEDFEVTGSEAFKLSSFVGDCGHYLHQAEGLGSGVEPFKYRLVVPFLANIVGNAFSVSLASSFILINIVATLLLGLGFTAYLHYEYKFSKLLALFGGLLAITSLSITRTLPFPMLEPMTMLASLAIFWTLRRKNYWLFAMASVFAVMTKEVFIFATPLFWALNFRFSKILSKENLICVLVGLVPFTTKIITKLALGGDAFEVEYGHSIFEGSMPDHYEKLFHFDGIIHYVGGVAVAFGAMWLGLLRLNVDRFTLISALIAIPLVLLATLLFSARISRVIGILFPVVIPPFLALLHSIARGDPPKAKIEA